MTAPRHGRLVDFIKEEHPQNGASEHQKRFDAGTIQSLNVLSRKDTMNSSQYVSAPAPAASSKRQLAGHNARIQQQPTRLEYPKSLPKVASPVNLPEAACRTYGEAPWSFQDSAAGSIKKEYSQNQSNGRNGFDTDVDDDFDDTTTISHDIQVENSQAHYASFVELHPGHDSVQELHDAYNVSDVSMHVESLGPGYIGSMATGIDRHYDLSEGAEYQDEEEEENTESDGSGEDGEADEPTLNSTSTSASLPPAVAQALERVHAMQNTNYSHQEFPEGSLENDAYPPTSDHEEDFDPTGHPPYREAVYRPKSNSPAHSRVPSAIRPKVGAIPLQKTRQAYEADLLPASGVDIVRSSTMNQVPARRTDENVCGPVSTVNITAVKARSSRTLHHQPSLEAEQQPFTASQRELHGILYHQAAAEIEQRQSTNTHETPHRFQDRNEIRIPVQSIPGADPNDNSSSSLSDPITFDANVLPLRKDGMVNQLPRQHDVTSACGQKHILELDYTEDQLSKMSYDQLRSESFDLNSKDSPPMFPEEVCSGPLNKQFEYIKDLKDVTEEQQTKMLQSFFSSLTIDQYEECGELVLELFSNILVKFKDARQEKRKIARNYEEEISQREQLVSGGSLRVDNEMRRIRQAGNDLLKGQAGLR
ncbi:hypothetical protein MMC18_000179 [Xylographa bjoerkii]|nr:hypothetical protein [Xylographa bjoerkii]